MAGQIPLSVCMIVRNEAHQLESALRNFRLFADEIVVVDTGSTDGTRLIARQYADVVADYPWHDDFAAARNASLAKARGRYFLWLDADDRVDDENVEKIRRLKNSWDGCAFNFILKDIRGGKPFVSLYQTRCVPNLPEIRFQGIVHERLDESLKKLGIGLVDTDIVIEHHGYDDPYRLKLKIKRNLDLLRVSLEKNPKLEDDPTFQYYFATQQHMLGNKEEALRSMKRCLHILKAMKFYSSGAHRHPVDYHIYDSILFCADILLDLKRPDEADRYLVQLKALPCLPPYVVFRMGRLAQRMQRYGEALGYFRRVDLNRQTVTRLPWPILDEAILVAHQAYNIYHLSGVDACSQYLASVSDEKVRSQAWEHLGLIAVDEEQWHLALEAFGRDWGKCRWSTMGWTAYGKVLNQEGRLSEAARAFEKALIEDAHNMEAAIKLATTYWQMGADRKALKLFAFLVAKGVDDPPVRKAYEVLHNRVCRST